MRPTARPDAPRFLALILRSVLAATLLLALGAAATAQSDADAHVRSAADRHATELLASTPGYRSEATATVFGPNEQPVAELRQVTMLDLSGAEPRLREELWTGDTLASVTQLDPDDAWTWTPDTGAVRLPPAQDTELRDSLKRGLLGLRYGADAIAADTVNDAFADVDAVADLDGVAVRTEIENATGTMLLADDGTLLAERYSSSQLGEVTVRYDDLREVSGVLLPFASELFANGVLVMRTETHELDLDVAFDDDAFALPEGADL